MQQVRQNAKKHKEHRRKNRVYNTSMNLRSNSQMLNGRRAKLTVEKMIAEAQDGSA